MNRSVRTRHATHRCPAAGCEQMIPRSHVLCSDHYAMVPAGFRVRLTEAREYGIAWKCHPTQQFLDLRSQVIQLVDRLCAQKYAKPQGTQTSLFAS